MKNWVLSAICWDGLIPALAALGPLLVSVFFPKRHIAVISSVIFLPMGLAIFRASLADRTLKAYFHGKVPLWRQLTLALAIIILLIVEFLFGLQIFEPQMPLLLFALVGWLGYFGLILAATLPPELTV